MVKAHIFETGWDGSDPYEKPTKELIQHNADKFATFLGCDVHIKLWAKVRGSRMLSYALMYGAHDVYSQRSNLGYFVHKRTPTGQYGVPKYLDELNVLRDHPRTISVRNKSGNWTPVGHMSSPYEGRFRYKVGGVDDIYRIYEDSLLHFDSDAASRYEVIVLGPEDSLYYPKTEFKPAYVDDNYSIIIIDRYKLSETLVK